MKDKLVRNVDEETWQKVRVLSATENLSFAEVIKMLVDFYEQQAEDLK